MGVVAFFAAPKADDNNRDRIIFSQFKPRRPFLVFAAFIQAFYEEIFLRLLLTAVYLAYIPKFIATQQTFDVFIPR